MNEMETREQVARELEYMFKYSLSFLKGNSIPFEAIEAWHKRNVETIANKTLDIGNWEHETQPNS